MHKTSKKRHITHTPDADALALETLCTEKALLLVLAKAAYKLNENKFRMHNC